MAEKFEKTVSIILVLLFLLGLVFTTYVVQDEKRLMKVIQIADGRTEYLLKQVNSLSERVANLEKKLLVQ